MMSRQQSQVAAGVPDADFHENDEVGNRCADINDYSIKWAKEHVSKSALARYNQLGVQMITGDDLGPYNEGPLWIWTYMSYKKDKTANTVTVQSPMMRTPNTYIVPAARGFHYCKVLSPFRVVEWIYTDSLFDHDGINNESEETDHFKDFAEQGITNENDDLDIFAFLS